MISTIWKTTILFSDKQFPFFLAFIFLQACATGKPEWDEPVKYQHYSDNTKKYFSIPPRKLEAVLFARMNRDRFSDLILIQNGGTGRNRVLTYLWDGKKGFKPHPKNGLDRNPKMNTTGLLSGDFNRDGVKDLVLLGRTRGKLTARLLLNNGKGYFYYPRRPLPNLKRGVEKGIVGDIDYDGDFDLLFFGRVLRDEKDRVLKNHAQLMLNNGKGNFEDATEILLPNLGMGMMEAAIADYDGDLVPDVFWVNSKGKNSLWINNGLGKFTDRSNTALPHLPGNFASADWADFDMDGDNDLLLAAYNIPEKYRAFTGEHCFFLENDGRGSFKKRSLKLLPKFPSRRVYLLDSDGNKSPDILILSQKGIHFYIGREPWTFSDESVKRLPYSALFSELAFGDADGDGLLDIFGIMTSRKMGRLWMDRLN